MNIKSTSLLISTYNRPDALAVCIDSVKKQTILPAQIVIADDGSTEDTQKYIAEVREQLPVPLVHVWHEDDGFRKSIILNKAAVECTGEYIIQIDGDIFLHPHFIEDHLYFAQEGRYLKGNRVSLNKELTDEICKTGKSRKISCLTAGILKKRELTCRSTFLAWCLSRQKRDNSRTAIGCNMSFWKKDFIHINGYNENFTGWGYEDENLARRLQLSGIGKKNLKFAGIVYHLWHTERSRDNAGTNEEYEKTQRLQASFRCEEGVNKYL